MGGRERRGTVLALFAAFIGCTIAGVLTRDHRTLSASLITVAVAAMLAGVAVSPYARSSLADRFPRTAWLWRRVTGLHWRTIGIALAACAAAIALAQAWKAVAYPRGDLAAHLERAYGPLHHSDRSPLLVADQLLDENWASEDQRYTAVGVLLRYEHDIVALVPDGHGGTSVEREDDDDGYRHYYAYVGDFWGPTYEQRLQAPPTAMALPGERDLAAVTGRLRDAGREQAICYRWDVEIRSGVREGRFRGSADAPGCRQYVRLIGWIDPNAGRFRRRGSPGRWSLGYEWTLDGEIPQADIEAIDVPLVEMIKGAMQKPSGHGARPGKGLIEYLEAMPLLAQDAVDMAPVLVAAGDVPRGARVAPVQRTDTERRADASWIGIPAALLEVGAGFVILFVLVGVLVGIVLRAVRVLRASI